MAMQEFALNETGTRRVQIFAENSVTNVTILVDRSIIGSISNREELMAGREFQLKDGTVLKVGLVNDAFQVESAGQVLRRMTEKDIAEADAKAAKEEQRKQAALEWTEATKRAALEIAEARRRAAFASMEGNRQAPAVSVSRGKDAPLFSLQKNLGWLIAGLGVLLALLAFFAIPYVSVGILSATASQIANVGTQYGNQFSQLQLLWLEALIAAILLIIIGVQVYRKMADPMNDTLGGAIGLIGLASVTVLFILGKYFLFDTQPTVLGTNGLGQSITLPALSNYYASGYWIYIVGIIIAIVGGVIAARSA